jgi:superfamily II DNA or RNA helicase
MSKYQDLMFRFSRESLKEHLGHDMVDVLIEWMPTSDGLLTKSKLIEMINYLHGVNILKSRSFRKDLLLAMESRDIYKIRDDCLSATEKQINDANTLVDIICRKSWGNNKLSKYLLSLWEYPSDVFDKEPEDLTVENTVNVAEQFFELLDYQYLIRQRILNNLNSGNLQERMLVHMPTGTGKTKTTMHTISNYYAFSLQNSGAILWVAHTTELLQQAYDTFVQVWSHLGNDSIKVYKLWGSRIISDDQPIQGIVFCGLAKLMSIKESNVALFSRLKKDCRLVVFDEAHKAAAVQTKRVIEDLLRMPEGFENRALIGLSATPGRTTADSYDNNLLSNMFGNKLITIDASILNQVNLGRLQALNAIAEENIIAYFQRRHILSKIKTERLQYQTEFSEAELKKLNRVIQDMDFENTDFTPAQLKILASNADRNRVIMERLRQLNNDQVPTIVFACSVNHAKMLSAMLTLEGISNSLVIGELDPVTRKKAIDAFKDKTNNVNVIINYEVLTTGFDSKNIRCVFITRPTKSVVLYSQMLGRGLRGPLMGGNEECLLIDVDDNLAVFNNESAFTHFNDYWRV